MSRAFQLRRIAGIHRHALHLAALLLATCLAPVALAPRPATATAAWLGAEEPVSGDGSLSRTTPSGRYVVQLPDRSLYGVWYTRTGARTSEVRGGRRATDGEWLAEAGPISEGDSLSRLPALATGGGGELYVVWVDNRHGNEEIYFRERDAEGNWAAERRLTATSETSLSPTVAATAGGWVHVAWSEGGQGHQAIHVVSRPPGGEWDPVLAVTDGRGNSENPVMQVDASGQAHLVWQDNIIDPIVNVDDPGNVEIYYMRLNSAGVPEIAPFRVSNALGRSQRPTLAVEPNGTVHIFWCDNRDRGPNGSGGSFPIALWYRRALPGLGFGHEKRFVYGIGDRLNPTAAVDGQGTINVAWEDYTASNAEIYYRQITPATGWDPFTTRLTATAGASQGPGLLAESNGTLHLLWSDLRSAEDLNVYYRQGQANATTPVTLGEVRMDATAAGVDVTWQTTDEIDHAGFQLYDAPATDEEARLVTPRLVTGADGHYQVRLAPDEAPAGSILKLVSIARNGVRRVEAERVVPQSAGPVMQPGAPRPYPNPSRGVVRIPVARPAAGTLELHILDVRGRLVTRLLETSAGDADLVFTWDGLDDRGRRAPAGRYYGSAWQGGAPVGPPISLLRLP